MATFRRASLSIGAFLHVALSDKPTDTPTHKSLCRPGDFDEGGCAVDGSGCSGDEVYLEPYKMSVKKWDPKAQTANLAGSIMSYAIEGNIDTWQMYLHGPHVHTRERPENSTAVPPLYAFGTFVNKVYKFENFSEPTYVNGEPQPLKAVQKMVGHVLAPSTGVIVQDRNKKLASGLLVAEGQPFLFSNIDTLPVHETYFGGVEYLPYGHKKNCTQLFPDPNFDEAAFKRGQIVNTVDCHDATGICFMSVWQFTDDQDPIWPVAEKMAGNDCLYYCVIQDGSLDDKAKPKCLKTAQVLYEDGTPVCHAKDLGAVHGMTVGNTDPKDPHKFDLLLVFTGKAEMTNGESSMKKMTVQVTEHPDGSRELATIKTQPFAEDLFQRFAPKGFDVGGDHAWVDETREYVWISCFREKGVGAHMVRYDTGELVYSVQGLDTYVPNQYTYTAGIHGVGTIGKKGSYLVIATCSCHDLEICIPIVPWHFPVPKKEWSIGVLFVVDLSSLDLHSGSPPKVETIVV